MKYAYPIFALVICLAMLQGCGQKKPEIADVEPLVDQYLTAKKALTCNGEVTLERLKINRIGDYIKEYGGWPVYSEFEVTCNSDPVSTTWKSTDDGETMTVLVRQTASGGYECFMPDIFRQAEEQLNKMLEVK
jgi:hypothetical protein